MMAKKKITKKKVGAKKAPVKRTPAAKKKKAAAKKRGSSKKKATGKSVKSSSRVTKKASGRSKAKKAASRGKTTRKVSDSKLKFATSHLRQKPEEVLAAIPAEALERMDGIARFRAAIQGMGVDPECAKCGFTGRYVQRQVIYVEPGSHYFRDKRRRTYLHLICMQCGHVEFYCPEAIGMNT